MAASQQSPPAKPPPPPAPTTIIDLGNDLLRDIFLRLPTLPSLLRAALSCRTFLNAVRSSPAFRRSFSAARPPPLLGFFFDPDGPAPAFPAFDPVRRRSDSDLAAVVRGGDFFLTRIPDDDDDFPGWVIEDCRDGHVLLQNFKAEKFSVYNPLAQSQLDLIPDPPGELFHDSHGEPTYLDCYILSSQSRRQQPLRLLYTCHDESRARAAVFSSDSREWEIFPWSEPVTPKPEENHWSKAGTMVNGLVYWIHPNETYISVLNTTTLEFSQMGLPSALVAVAGDFMFKVGENKDGELCIVCPTDFDLLVWVRRRSGTDGVAMWIFDEGFPMEPKYHGELRVVAIISGYVYFSTASTDDALNPCWFLSLCMETSKVGTIFLKRFDRDRHTVYPYIMAWPPCLIHNKLQPQLQGA